MAVKRGRKLIVSGQTAGRLLSVELRYGDWLDGVLSPQGAEFAYSLHGASDDAYLAALEEATNKLKKTRLPPVMVLSLVNSFTTSALAEWGRIHDPASAHATGTA